MSSPPIKPFQSLTLTPCLILLRYTIAALGMSNSKNWVFDVSALMVLISENEELKFRLARRSLLEAFCSAPVAGIQTYLKSYEILFEPSSYLYFSPYGCKTAPLRNMKLDNAIKRSGLLEDGKYTSFIIPQRTARPRPQPKLYIQWLWAAFTWTCSGGLLIFCLKAPGTTWIGLTNLLVLTGWSILLRVIECIMIKPASLQESMVTRPNESDAIMILGRSQSALVLSGSRSDIKAWTTRGLLYNQHGFCKRMTTAWQIFTKGGTLLVLILMFSTVPNGSTMDQLVFILLNVLGQANTLVGLSLNAKACLALLEQSADSEHDVPSRTHLYAALIRQFKHIEEKNWISVANLLPQTAVWGSWRERIEADIETDPKELYNRINDEHKIKVKQYPPVNSNTTTTTKICHLMQPNSAQGLDRA